MGFRKVYEEWKSFPELDENLRQQLIQIENDENEIEDRFHKSLEFGTAGLRGILGAGTNRMNIYTVRQATQGLSEYIKKTGDTQKGVVIAYDSRNFSLEFALESAKVLCANGIKTYLFESLRPTPELSFAVRHLGCVSGIVITASHNPAKYNGYKVYGEDGAQMPLDAADAVTEEIRNIDMLRGVKLIDEKEAIEKNLLIYIGEEVDKKYLECVFERRVNPDAIKDVSDSFSVVYTPFHGSGNMLVQRILNMCGLKNLLVVKEQEQPDGNFPTVKSPNPEDKEGFTIAIELAKKNNTDLIVGTDPDSDRVGIVVRNSGGEYVTFTGNQVGALLTDYILAQHKEKGTMPENPVVIKSVVTTEMVRSIADFYGVEMMEVLTGFKFIGEKIKEFEENNSHSYVFGFEESYGYLSGTYARDKDAVVATMLIVEMAAWYKKQNMTLFDALEALYKKYGYYAEGVVNIVEEGLEGPARIAAMINNIRTGAPKEIAKLSVDAVRDYVYGTIKYSDGSEKEINQPKNNMLYLEMDGGNAWIAIRPSGTEPKLKLYFGYRNEDKDKALEKLEELKCDTQKIIKRG